MGNGLIKSVQLSPSPSTTTNTGNDNKIPNEYQKNVLPQNKELQIDHGKVKEKELEIRKTQKETEEKLGGKIDGTSSSKLGIENLNKVSLSSNFKLPIPLKSSSSFLESPSLSFHRSSTQVNTSSSSVSSSRPSQQSRQLAQLVDATRYDEIISWLDWEFRKADINQDGNLEYHEFFRFMKALDLRLTNSEIFSFYSYADTDRDGIVVWSEILKDIPNILKHIYKGLPPGIHDWCIMSQDGIEILYFNKRTGIATSTKPAILSDAVPMETIADNQTQEISSSFNIKSNGHIFKEGIKPTTTVVEMQSSPSPSKTKLDTITETNEINISSKAMNSKEDSQVEVNNTTTNSSTSTSYRTPSKTDHTTSNYDTILTWLDWEFHKADLDSNGFLSKSEFLRFVSGLQLGLTKKECDTFYTYADLDGDGKIILSEVTELAPQILKKIYESIEPGPKDWCKITREEEAWIEREVEIDTGE